QGLITDQPGRVVDRTEPPPVPVLELETFQQFLYDHAVEIGSAANQYFGKMIASKITKISDNFPIRRTVTVAPNVMGELHATSKTLKFSYTMPNGVITEKRWSPTVAASIQGQDLDEHLKNMAFSYSPEDGIAVAGEIP